MSVRKRKLEADYINTAAAGAAAPIYSLCGTGFSKLDESPSAKTSKKQYINQDSASQHVTGYEWSASFEADQIKSEAALNFIVNIGRKLLTGPDAETDFIQVDLDDPTADKANVFKARRRTIAISLSEMPDKNGELSIKGVFLGATDPVEGTFDTGTKTFTPNA